MRWGVSDTEAFTCFDQADLELANQTVRPIAGIGLWATVNQSFVAQLIEINNIRLARWRTALVDDDVPTDYNKAP